MYALNSCFYCRRCPKIIGQADRSIFGLRKKIHENQNFLLEYDRHCLTSATA